MGLLPIRRSVQPSRVPGKEKERSQAGNTMYNRDRDLCKRQRSIIYHQQWRREFWVLCESVWMQTAHRTPCFVDKNSSSCFLKLKTWMALALDPSSHLISANTILLPTLTVLQFLPSEHPRVLYNDNYLACLPTGRPGRSINNWHQHLWQPLIQHHENWNILHSSRIKRKQTLIFPDQMETTESVKGQEQDTVHRLRLSHACSIVHPTAPSSWNAPFTAWKLSASRHEWDIIFKRNLRHGTSQSSGGHNFTRWLNILPKWRKYNSLKENLGIGTRFHHFSRLDAYKHMVSWLILPGDAAPEDMKILPRFKESFLNILTVHLKIKQLKAL